MNLFKKSFSTFLFLFLFVAIVFFGLKFAKADVPTPSPVTVNVWADNDLLHLNETAHIHWLATPSGGYSITQCRVTTDVGGGATLYTSYEAGGSFSQIPQTSTTFAVICNDDFEPTSRTGIGSIWIAVGPSPIVTITPNPVVSTTSTYTVNWSASWADSCTSSTGQGGTGKTGTFSTTQNQNPEITVTCTRNAITAGTPHCSGFYNLDTSSCGGGIGVVSGSIGNNGEMPGPYEGDSCSVFSPQSNCPMGWLNHPCSWSSSSVQTSCNGLSIATCQAQSGCSWNPSVVALPAWTSSTTVSPILQTIVTLELGNAVDSGYDKDLVKADSGDLIGTSYLYSTIQNLPIGYNCKLIKNGNTVTPEVTWTNDFTFNKKTVQNLPSTSDNVYQIKCFNASNAYIGVSSLERTAKAQSGTLEKTGGGAATCTIPVNGSNCTVPVSWTTTNPQTGVTTYFSGVAVPVTGDSGTNVPITVSGNSGGQVVVSTWNKVDGETTGETTDNKLKELTVNVSCEGSIWDDVSKKCKKDNSGLPDLVALTPTPSSTTTGAPTVFHADIKNQGIAAASIAPFYNLFQTTDDPCSTASGGNLSYKKDNSFLSLILGKTKTANAGCAVTITGNYRTVSTMDNLPPGGVLSATSPQITFATGTHYVRACADKASQSSAEGDIPESNENNNCSAWDEVMVSPTPAPDLIAVSPGPNTATKGAAKTFSATISNQGNASTGKQFSNLFQVSNLPFPIAGGGNVTDYVAPLSMPTLAAGASAVTSRSITFLNIGTYYMRVCADKTSAGSAGVVSESNENNNCSAPSTVVVSAVTGELSDLTAGTITPTTVGVGLKIKFLATISNIGNATTGVGFDNFFQISLNKISIIDVTPSVAVKDALNHGNEIVINKEHIFSDTGKFYVRVCADKTNRNSPGVIDESNEDNNCSPDWTLITVSKASDLCTDIEAQNYGKPLPCIPFGKDICIDDKATNYAVGWPCEYSSSEPAVCSIYHYDCKSGTSINNTINATNWTWDCEDNNGKTVSCSEDTQKICPNEAINYPACDDFSCPAGTSGKSPNCTCDNNAINPIACTMCSNGATNPPACDDFSCPAGTSGKSPNCTCDNGADNPPTCNVNPDPDTCFNKVQDKNEKGIDCGGVCAKSCKKVPKFIER